MKKLLTIAMVLMCLAISGAEQTDATAKQARNAAMDKASHDYFEAMDQCFVKMEQAQRQYAAALDKAIAQATRDGNNDLVAQLTAEKKHALANADLAMAHDRQVLPREAFVELAGMKSRGKKVIYLCQASGSMLSQFGAVKNAMQQSIARLSNDDGIQFNVIFFSGDNVFTLFRDGVQDATDDNKKVANAFVTAALSSDRDLPMPAIKTAFSQKPDVIFLLSDGFDTCKDKDEISTAFKTSNADGRVTLNVGFFETEADAECQKCLERIARDGRGQFKKVSAGPANR